MLSTLLGRHLWLPAIIQPWVSGTGAAVGCRHEGSTAPGDPPGQPQGTLTSTHWPWLLGKSIVSL